MKRQGFTVVINLHGLVFTIALLIKLVMLYLTVSMPLCCTILYSTALSCSVLQSWQYRVLTCPQTYLWTATRGMC